MVYKTETCFCVRCGELWKHYGETYPKTCKFCNSPNWRKLFYVHICGNCGRWWKSNSKKPRSCPHCFSTKWHNFPFSRRCVKFMSRQQFQKKTFSQYLAIIHMTPSNANVFESMRKTCMLRLLDPKNQYKKYYEKQEEHIAEYRRKYRNSFNRAMTSKVKQRYYRSKRYVDANYFQINSTGLVDSLDMWTHLPVNR